MKRLLVILFGILLPGCPAEKDPAPERPPGVKLIPYSGPGEMVESGIRPKPGPQNYILLEWEAVQGALPLDRYEIYRGVSLDSVFRLVKSVPADDLPIAEDDSVVVDQTYYYYVRAVDDRGVGSQVDNYFETQDSIAQYIRSFTLGPKVTFLVSPTSTDTVVTTKPLFVWCNQTGNPIQYVLRIGNGPSSDVSTIWIATVPPTFFDLDCSGFENRELLTFHDSTYTVPAQPVPDSLLATAPVVTIDKSANVWKSARLTKSAFLWRVDAVFGDNHVSHSMWVPFLVNRDF